MASPFTITCPYRDHQTTLRPEATIFHKPFLGRARRHVIVAEINAGKRHEIPCRLVAVAVTVFALVILAGSSPPRADVFIAQPAGTASGADVGRYQLVPAGDGLYVFDSATGRTWQAHQDEEKHGDTLGANALHGNRDRICHRLSRRRSPA